MLWSETTVEQDYADAIAEIASNTHIQNIIKAEISGRADPATDWTREKRTHIGDMFSKEQSPPWDIGTVALHRARQLVEEQQRGKA